MAQRGRRRKFSKPPKQLKKAKKINLRQPREVLPIQKFAEEIKSAEATCAYDPCGKKFPSPSGWGMFCSGSCHTNGAPLHSLNPRDRIARETTMNATAGYL